MWEKTLNKALSYSGKGRDLLRVNRLQKGYLGDWGWLESHRNRSSTDAKGEALPWFTYPSIAFLAPRVKKDFAVFEYGSGNSTLWFSKLAGKVYSTEHDQEWYDKMKDPLAAAGVNYVHRDLDSGSYAREISRYENEFDIVILDGRHRVACCKNSLPSLRPAGVIIWDNANRERYEEGYEFLIKQGYKRLDFWGLGPISPKGSCTSIFYKEGNCLNL